MQAAGCFAARLVVSMGRVGSRTAWPEERTCPRGASLHALVGAGGRDAVSSRSARTAHGSNRSPFDPREGGPARVSSRSFYRPDGRTQTITIKRHRAMMLTRIPGTKSKGRTASRARSSAFSRARRSARSSAEARSSRKGW